MPAEIPKYHQFHWPIIVALRKLGGSATIEELNSQVVTAGGYQRRKRRSFIRTDR